MNTTSKTAVTLLLLCPAVTFLSYVTFAEFSTVTSLDSQGSCLISSHRDYDIDEKYQKARAKIILFWTPMWNFHSTWPTTFSDRLNEECAVSNCLFTDDRSQLDNADAVLFHLTGDDLNAATPFPTRRPSGQIWVLYSIEAPPLKYIASFNLTSLNGLFNWTMTYRWDSDLPVPYGFVLPRYPLSNTVQLDSLPEAVRRALPLRPRFVRGLRGLPKKRLVTWMVSNCDDVTSQRAEYANELKKYIEVDTYGWCGDLKCGKRDGYPDKENVNAPCQQIMSDSKFYLAFENAICPEYATEKLYRSLTLGTVPVVLGGAQYSELIPDGSYIDALQYEPQQLAQLLLHLNDNDTAYQEFFRWQDSHSVINPVPERPLTCGLCQRLHELSPGELVGSHDDIERLYSPAQCFQWVPNQPLKRLDA